ncbi:hypothetical protein EYC80_003289 [Monilinia laxa]|uniref:Uncharacterized protein n=1 Tax=Monilinia laxa TaxID=61186 RepID=A0A5N6KDA3_MONLA|nr:hypothetical protein EYC80_003289 [Monilinia laxa]
MSLEKGWMSPVGINDLGCYSHHLRINETTLYVSPTIYRTALAIFSINPICDFLLKQASIFFSSSFCKSTT